MTLKITALTLAAAATLAGCASIVDGGNQNINLNPSTGQNVKVKVTSRTGTTEARMPSIVSIPKDKSNLLVTVDDPCYEPTTVSSTPTLNPWALGNLFISVFGLTGTTVDASSGNAWKYDNTINVPVTKKSSCR